MALTLLVRAGPMAWDPGLWSEDGSHYFADSVHHGLASLLIPYAGYHHLLLRVISLALVWLPAAWIPGAYTFAPGACTVAVAWLVLRARLPRLDRRVLALALVLVPVGHELFLNVTNLMWITACLIPILLLQEPPESRRRAHVEAGLMLLVGLTGPYVVIFSPLLAWRAGNLRTRSDGLLVAAGSAALALQLWTLLTTHGSGFKGTLAGLLPASTRFVGGFLLGADPQSLPWSPAARLALTLPPTLLLVAALIAAWRSGYARWVGALLACAGVVFASALVRCDGSGLDPVHSGQRYFYLPYLFLAWALTSLLSCPRLRRYGVALLAVVLSLGLRTAHQEPPRMPANWTRTASKLSAGHSAILRVAPSGWTFAVAPRGGAPHAARLNRLLTDPDALPRLGQRVEPAELSEDAGDVERLWFLSGRLVEVTPPADQPTTNTSGASVLLSFDGRWALAPEGG